MKSYILIKVAMGHVEDVAAAIRRMPGVISSDATFGVYDVIVLAEAGTMHDMGLLVAKEIQSVQGVLETTTCFAMA